MTSRSATWTLRQVAIIGELVRRVHTGADGQPRHAVLIQIARDRRGSGAPYPPEARAGLGGQP